MQRLRQWLRNWFGFSRTESNGFVVLLPLMIVLVTSEPLYRYYLSTLPFDFSSDEKKLDSLIAHWKVRDHQLPEVQKTESVELLHTFNPNKVTESEMKSLGFPEHLSRRIANYRLKGGVFRIKADLLKMYGVDSTFYHQLYAYIALPEKIERPFPKQNFTAVKEIAKPKEKFDLNTADSITLEKIQGIGPALAARIMKFRNALGGFVSASQLSEVYGLDSLVARRVKEASFISDGFKPIQIDLNKSDEKTLASHPYIRKALAKAIISYRFQHGNFKNPQEISRIFSTTPLQAEKLIPYVTVQE